MSFGRLVGRLVGNASVWQSTRRTYLALFLCFRLRLLLSQYFCSYVPRSVSLCLCLSVYLWFCLFDFVSHCSAKRPRTRGRHMAVAFVVLIVFSFPFFSIVFYFASLIPASPRLSSVAQRQEKTIHIQSPEAWISYWLSINCVFRRSSLSIL